MKKKENTFYTIHDEIFNDIVINGTSSSNKKDRIKVSLDGERLSTKELVVLIILYDYYIKHNGEPPWNSFKLYS